MKDGLKAVILARPGLMRNSLLAFLRGLPRVEVMAMVEDAETALQVIRDELPHILLADMDLSEDDILTLLRRLAQESCYTRSIILASSQRQQQASLQAGANYSFIKGFLDGSLGSAVLGEATQPVRKLMTGRGPEHL